MGSSATGHLLAAFDVVLQFGAHKLRVLAVAHFIVAPVPTGRLLIGVG